MIEMSSSGLKSTTDSVGQVSTFSNAQSKPLAGQQEAASVQSGALAELQKDLHVSRIDRTVVSEVEGSRKIDLVVTPPTPPSIALNDDLMLGAEVFASQIDLVGTDMARVFEQGIGSLQSSNETIGGEISTTSQIQSITTSPASPSDVRAQKSLLNLSSEELLSLFLKLNINDPNNSVETHNAMHQLASELRQQGIAEAKKRADNAARLREKANDFADKMGVALMVLEVVSVVTLIFGVGAALMALKAALTAAAKQAIKEAVKGAVKESVKEAVKEAVQQAGSEATKEAVQEAVNKAVQESLKEALSGPAKEAIQAALKESLQEGAKNITEEALQEAVQEVVQESVQEAVQEALKEGLKEVGKEALLESLVGGVLETTTSVVQAFLKNSLAEIIKNAAPQLAKAAKFELVRQVVGTLSSLTKTGIETKIQDKSNKAREAEVDSERFRLMAALMQEMVEEQSEIVKLIIESKNRTVDSVVQMLKGKQEVDLKINQIGIGA